MSSVGSKLPYEGRKNSDPTDGVFVANALKLQELRNAIHAGAASGPGVDADSAFDRLERKYQAASGHS